MSFGRSGEKYDDLFFKKREYRGKRWGKKGRKEDIFTVKNMIFEKGGGQNINYFENIHHCI